MDENAVPVIAIILVKNVGVIEMEGAATKDGNFIILENSVIK